MKRFRHRWSCVLSKQTNEYGDMLMKVHPIIHERVNYIPGVITAIKKKICTGRAWKQWNDGKLSIFVVYSIFLNCSVYVFFKQDDLTAFVVA